MCTEKMKKGYIFLMDAIFAVILLVIGLIIVSSNTREESTETSLAITMDNSISLLASLKVSDICNGCSCSIKKIEDLCTNNNIRNTDQSLLDYVGELYSRNKTDDAYLVIKNISVEKDIFREKELFGSEMSIEGRNIYPIMTPEVNLSKKQSQNLLSSRRIIFGYYEDALTGQVIYWGPYEVKLELWEKQ